MQTHRDDDFGQTEESKRWLAKLQRKAEKMKALGQSEITGGDDVLNEWEHGRVYVRQLGDDPDGVLRVSTGGGDTPIGGDYCTFRGNRHECIRLLRRALKALEKVPV